MNDAGAGSPHLVSTEWLASRLGQPGMVIVDGSWYLPTLNRDPRKEYLAEHIPGAVFFGAITYPLFLIHGRLGYMALERFATEQNKYFVYSLLIILAIVIAYLMLQLDRRIQKTISKI